MGSPSVDETPTCRSPGEASDSAPRASHPHGCIRDRIRDRGTRVADPTQRPITDGGLIPARRSWVGGPGRTSPKRLDGARVVLGHASHRGRRVPTDDPTRFAWSDGGWRGFHLPGAALYELHVWAWRDNPNGTYVDWNPKVSCEETE